MRRSMALPRVYVKQHPRTPKPFKQWVGEARHSLRQSMGGNVSQGNLWQPTIQFFLSYQQNLRDGSGVAARASDEEKRCRSRTDTSPSSGKIVERLQKHSHQAASYQPYSLLSRPASHHSRAARSKARIRPSSPRPAHDSGRGYFSRCFYE